MISGLFLIGVGILGLIFLIKNQININKNQREIDRIIKENKELNQRTKDYLENIENNETKTLPRV